MVKLTIDGKEVEAEKDKTILETAMDNGITIPTLCYHKALSGYGACRLCMVEVVRRGRAKLVTSCTYPVQEGIEVHTNSEKVMKARKGILELLLARCPESKELWEMAHSMGIKSTPFKTRGDPNEKCILCGLCTRICQDVIEVGAVGFINRGVNRKVLTPFNELSDVCTTCGACAFVCPTDAINLEDISKNKPIPIHSEFERGLTSRPVMYVPFPQAVPNIPVLDKENCMYYLSGKCKVCEKFCEAKAIVYDQEDEFIDVDIGTIVLATGFDLYKKELIGEYGSGRYKDVIDGLQFERLLASSGPTEGTVLRPSDGKVPKEIVFIQCVRSRDPEHGVAYCSKVCCMYTAKQALLYKHAVPDGQAYIFYIDIRSDGKGYEEFVQRAIEHDNIVYIRSRVSKILQEGDKIVVCGADTLTGKQVEISADMVVLATAIVPSPDAKELSKILRIPVDEYGWYREAHLKLRPLETQTGGIFIAGASQYPKDITDAVAQGSGAAAKVLDILTKEELERDPIIATVDEEICVGCGKCIAVCPYDAIEIDEKKHVSKVNAGLCEGCGGCSGNCPSNAINLTNYKKRTVFDVIDALAQDPEEVV